LPRPVTVLSVMSIWLLPIAVMPFFW